MINFQECVVILVIFILPNHDKYNVLGSPNPMSIMKTPAVSSSRYPNSTQAVSALNSQSYLLQKDIDKNSVNNRITEEKGHTEDRRNSETINPQLQTNREIMSSSNKELTSMNNSSLPSNCSDCRKYDQTAQSHGINHLHSFQVLPFSREEFGNLVNELYRKKREVFKTVKSPPNDYIRAFKVSNDGKKALLNSDVSNGVMVERSKRSHNSNIKNNLREDDSEDSYGGSGTMRNQIPHMYVVMVNDTISDNKINKAVNSHNDAPFPYKIISINTDQQSPSIFFTTSSPGQGFNQFPKPKLFNKNEEYFNLFTNKNEFPILNAQKLSKLDDYREMFNIFPSVVSSTEAHRHHKLNKHHTEQIPIFFQNASPIRKENKWAKTRKMKFYPRKPEFYMSPQKLQEIISILSLNPNWFMNYDMDKNCNDGNGIIRNPTDKKNYNSNFQEIDNLLKSILTKDKELTQSKLEMCLKNGLLIQNDHGLEINVDSLFDHDDQMNETELKYLGKVRKMYPNWKIYLVAQNQENNNILRENVNVFNNSFSCTPGSSQKSYTTVNETKPLLNEQIDNLSTLFWNDNRISNKINELDNIRAATLMTTESFKNFNNFKQNNKLFDKPILGMTTPMSDDVSSLNAFLGFSSSHPLSQMKKKNSKRPLSEIMEELEEALENIQNETDEETSINETDRHISNGSINFGNNKPWNDDDFYKKSTLKEGEDFLDQLIKMAAQQQPTQNYRHTYPKNNSDEARINNETLNSDFNSKGQFSKFYFLVPENSNIVNDMSVLKKLVAEEIPKIQEELTELYGGESYHKSKRTITGTDGFNTMSNGSLSGNVSIEKLSSTRLAGIRGMIEDLLRSGRYRIDRGKRSAVSRDDGGGNDGGAGRQRGVRAWPSRLINTSEEESYSSKFQALQADLQELEAAILSQTKSSSSRGGGGGGGGSGGGKTEEKNLTLQIRVIVDVVNSTGATASPPQTGGEPEETGQLLKRHAKSPQEIADEAYEELKSIIPMLLEHDTSLAGEETRGNAVTMKPEKHAFSEAELNSFTTEASRISQFERSPLLTKAINQNIIHNITDLLDKLMENVKNKKREIKMLGNVSRQKRKAKKYNSNDFFHFWTFCPVNPATLSPLELLEMEFVTIETPVQGNYCGEKPILDLFKPRVIPGEEQEDTEIKINKNDPQVIKSKISQKQKASFSYKSQSVTEITDITPEDVINLENGKFTQIFTIPKYPRGKRQIINRIPRVEDRSQSFYKKIFNVQSKEKNKYEIPFQLNRQFLQPIKTIQKLNVYRKNTELIRKTISPKTVSRNLTIPQTTTPRLTHVQKNETSDLFKMFSDLAEIRKNVSGEDVSKITACKKKTGFSKVTKTNKKNIVSIGKDTCTQNTTETSAEQKPDKTTTKRKKGFHCHHHYKNHTDRQEHRYHPEKNGTKTKGRGVAQRRPMDSHGGFYDYGSQIQTMVDKDIAVLSKSLKNSLPWQ